MVIRRTAQGALHALGFAWRRPVVWGKMTAL